jgi:cytochrome b involved in lipid metabolism
MKNTFTISMLIFWGIIVSITSAGYVIKQNRLAQESMQKTYLESIKQITEALAGNKVATIATAVTKPVVTPVATKPTTGTVTPKPVVTTPAPTPKPVPTPTPTPAPVTPSGPTSATVATHNTQSNCWIIVSGKVYSVTSYIPMHPGGSKKIVNVCGEDATNAFDGAGHSSKAYSLLGQYLVGTLQ